MAMIPIDPYSEGKAVTEQLRSRIIELIQKERYPGYSAEPERLKISNLPESQMADIEEQLFL